MPVYVYQCKNCNHVFEQRQSFSDDALRVCPQCGEETLRKRYNTVGVTFKGPASTAPTRETPKRKFHTSQNEGRGNTGCPAPRRLRSTPSTEVLHDIVTPVRRTLLTHPFQTLTLLRGQRLRRSSRSLRTRLLGVLVFLGVLALSISFLRGSPAAEEVPEATTGGVVTPTSRGSAPLTEPPPLTRR